MIGGKKIFGQSFQVNGMFLNVSGMGTLTKPKEKSNSHFLGQLSKDAVPQSNFLNYTDLFKKRNRKSTISLPRFPIDAF